MASKKPAYEVFVAQKNGEKNYYTKIGAAWSVSKGGLSIKLSALPLNGECVLFPLKENETQ